MPDPFDEESTESTEEAPRKGSQDKAFDRITQERDAAREAAKAAEARALAAERKIAFDDLKIDRKYSDLYQGDVDTEAIKAWAMQYGFVDAPPAAAAPEAGAPEVPAPAEPAPTAPAQAGEPPVVGGNPASFQPKISVRDYQKMILDGRTEEAAKLYNEGRVEILTGGKFTGGSIEEE